MIEHLRIENFKCWKDTGNITLSPITVFFGANSSGKSSIGQFLMMLKQSVESSDRKTAFFTGDENSYVDLGLPSDMILNHDRDKNIKFSYDWSLDRQFVFEDVVHQVKKNVDHISFSGDVSVPPKAQSFVVNEIHYELSDNNRSPIGVHLKRKNQSGAGRKVYELSTDNYTLVRNPGRVWAISSPVRFYGFPDEAVAYHQNAGFLQSVNLLHERMLSNIYYLGPLRNRAKRLYSWVGSIPRDVGSLGGDAISAMLAADEEQRLINVKYRSPRKGMRVIVAEMLRKMNLIDDFMINRVSDNRQDYEVKVRTIGSENYVDIPDVGVGVSQVLPVIVELFYAPPGSTIIIEQPELHLHPSAQAGLADVMIDAIHAREEWKNRNIQIIIESHSEHFLRRLQRRLAEDVLEQDALTAYFINYRNGLASLEQLQLDLFGDIANWPDNFFGDITGDIIHQTEAALDKRLKSI